MAERPHVGFDARWYFEGPVSNRLVTRELLRALAKSSAWEQMTAVVVGGQSAVRALERECPGVRGVAVPDLTMMGGAVLAVPWVLLRHRIDVFVAQNFVPPFGAKRNIAFIYDGLFLRRPELFTWAERLYLSSVRPLAKGADAICTISHSERDELLKAGIGTRGDVSVVWCAPRPEFLDVGRDDIHKARRELGLPQGYVLSLGRLNVRKNVGALLAAVEASRCVTDQCPLVVAGPVDGQQEEGLFAQMEALGPRLIRLGFVDDHLIPGLVAGATLLVSLAQFEGFGLPPLEAMAAGVPVLVARSRVAEEVMGDAPVFVDDVHEARAVAQALDELIEGDFVRQAAIRRGRERAGGYSWDVSAAVLSGVVEKVWAER